MGAGPPGRQDERVRIRNTFRLAIASAIIRRRLRPFWSSAGSMLFASAAMFAGAAVEFNRDIRPILSDRCYACHGPDQGARKSKLRLDTEAGAKLDLGGHFGIVPGDSGKSEVVKRITATGGTRMPPPWSGAQRLSDKEIDLIVRWIEQGAKWEKHWSFIPPVRPELPAVSDPHWPKSAIDNFVLARLDAERLKPSPEADRRTLIRRLSLDLTGLPPSPAEVESFVNDTAANAYEKVVDRLLASPRYGERMAVRWLERGALCRHERLSDRWRAHMWRWRDWVINAFNRNMPFDQFTVEQIAGDMLAERDARSEDRDRLQSQPSRQRRRRHHSRRVRRGIRCRSRGHDVDGLARS